MIFSFLFQKRPFLILWMTILYVVLQKHSEGQLQFYNQNVNWLHNNKMVVNPDKFQAILLYKGRSDNTNIEVEIGIKKIRSTLSVKLFGVHSYIDDKLNFNEQINKICKSAGNQLNALIRPKSFLGLKEREVLVNNFIYSTFSYCALVWIL